MYNVCVNDVPSHYGTRYFPRKIKYLRDAKRLAREVLQEGASLVRIEYPNGGELDLRQRDLPNEKLWR